MKFLKANRRPLTDEEQAVIARLNALADRTRSGLLGIPKPEPEQPATDSISSSDPLEIRDSLQ